MSLPLSILDLAHIGEDMTARDSLEASVAMARHAEELGFGRVWYAEHHNMATIASSATSVLIAHVAANTRRIRLGSGGIMLPNHSPLVIAEQFGTLETLHPGRIDLGLGRAPGTDMNTLRALRRSASSADSFPQDVVELQGYLAGESRIPGVDAVPGAGTNVPLYILGSSLFGAKLAATLGLPYAFASHFAPQALEDAVSAYRDTFQPSQMCPEPYVIAGVSVTAAPTAEEAHERFARARRRLASQLLGRGRALTEQEVDAAVQSPQVRQMMTYSAVGDPNQVKEYLEWFATHARADELILAPQGTGGQAQLRSLELVAEAMGLEAG